MKTRRNHSRRGKAKANRTGRRRIRGGGSGNRIRFSNNTKPPAATNNNYNNSPEYLNELYDRMSETRIAPSPLHEENAHMLAKVAAYHSSLPEMARDLRLMYYPRDLSVRDFSILIDLVYDAPIDDDRKNKILSLLRYKRAILKLNQMFHANQEAVPIKATTADAATTTATPIQKLTIAPLTNTQ